MNTKRVVRLYYLFQFFFSLLLWIPVFYEFQKRIGLNDAQIFSIQSVYYAFFCLLEVPTGFLADRFGHRLCLRGGAIVLVAANLLPCIAAGQTYSGFLVHFLLIGVARSLISGASSAYIYDYLKKHGDVSAFKQAEGNARAYGLIGKVVCWAAVGPLMQWQLTLPYSLTALAAAVSVYYSFRLPAIEGAESSRESLALAPVGRMLVASPILVLMMLQGVSIFVLSRICQVNLFQPILAEKSFGVASYGVIMSVTTVFEAIGSARPGWFRRYASDLNSVFVLTVAMALSLSLIAISGKAGTLANLCVFSLATGFSFPIQRQLLNDAITRFGDVRYRATLLSVESIIDRAACAGVAAVLGDFVGTGRTDVFLLVSAGVSLGLMLILFFVLRPMRVEPAAVAAR